MTVDADKTVEVVNHQLVEILKGRQGESQGDCKLMTREYISERQRCSR